jgi:hypothetical protein
MKVMWKQNTLNHTIHFPSYHLKFIIKKIATFSLPYGELKFEKWTSKLLLSFSKGLNKKKQ